MKYKVISTYKVPSTFGELTKCDLQSLCGKYTASVHSKLAVGEVVDHYNLDCISRVQKRLSKIGIDVRFSGNFPWIYLDSVNGVKVRQPKNARHGYCVAYGTRLCYLTHRKDLFNKIREMLQ